MRLRYFIPLLKLRYRLFWARARSRRAKIALSSGVFLVGWIAVLLGMGGGGVGVVASRFAKPTVAADFAFGMVFVWAMVGALVFALDSPAALSDESLRRYPLTRLDRLAARYAVGLFDPLWLLVFVLDFSITAGFVATSAARWWAAFPAAALLFLTNYLAARLLAEVVGRITATRVGSAALILAFAVLLASAGALPLALQGPNRPETRLVLAALKFTPPLAVATVVTGASALVSLGAMLVTLVWLLGVGFALVSLEGRPVRSKAVAGAEATWNSPHDLFAAMFGPTLAPLVGKTLRYYVRTPMFALNYLFCVIGPTLLTLPPAFGGADPLAHFFAALAAVSFFVGYGGIGTVTSNAFGFDRSGFRRYFFSPVSSRSILRAMAFVPLALGAPSVPLSLGVFLVFWHAGVDSRMVILWFSVGFGGLLLFQGLGLWTSLFSPRARDFEIRYGKTLPMAQNILMIVSMASCPVLLAIFHVLGSATLLAYWWVAVLALLPVAAFYIFTLRRAGSVLRARREQMLPILERNP